MGEITNERNIKVLALEMQKLREEAGELQVELRRGQALVQQLQTQVESLRAMVFSTMATQAGSGPTSQGGG